MKPLFFLLFFLLTNLFSFDTYRVKLIKKIQHPKPNFTQGLVFHQNKLYESTGLYGHSSLRIFNLKNEKLHKEIKLNKSYFAEGLCLLKKNLYQLTWKKGKCFVYNKQTLIKQASLSYSGEGWGLTTDNKYFIKSDGTSYLHFLTINGFKPHHKIRVTLDGDPIKKLNELEYINGKIFANVWYEDEIIIINPKSGDVTGIVNITSLLKFIRNRKSQDVLNGIAYNLDKKTLLLTGKNWPYIFEVMLIKTN